MNRRTTGLLTALGGLMLAGCIAVGPDYKVPEFKDHASKLPDAGLPKEVAKKQRHEISRDEVSAWWTVFKDQTLDGLMGQAFTNNLSVKAGLARVRQARARLGATEGRWWPGADARGGMNRFRTGKNGQSGRRVTDSLFSGGLDASWELDIFGGLRRSVEAAEASLEGAVAGAEQVWVTQAAEVALNYAGLRTVQERLKVARTNLDIQGETLQILLSRLKSGIGDELAVQQARYNMETTRATIPSLLAVEESHLNALSVLVGVEPGTLHEQLKTAKPQLSMEPRFLVGIAAEYLRRRPDIRQAERQLAMHAARVGEATAELYPKFALNGSIGLESLEGEDLFKSQSLTWSFGPSFRWAIFHGGTLRANIAYQDALYEEAYANYNRILLLALKEIRDALSAYSQEYHRYKALDTAVKAAQAAVNISQDLYASGLRDFNNVLDAQRSLLALEESFTVSKGNIVTHLIALYKALGGGWSSWESWTPPRNAPSPDGQEIDPLLTGGAGSRG